ncbi:hypothetical protein BZA70DRAFT_280264 [Myxozyma melibiosi]|uniref:Uncharacterized protein n=1 Tax=Myxozyma melibiosi TaxID=54550 RepID=A0ABR1F4Y2_9ASCO
MQCLVFCNKMATTKCEERLLLRARDLGRNSAGDLCIAVLLGLGLVLLVHSELLLDRVDALADVLVLAAAGAGSRGALLLCAGLAVAVAAEVLEKVCHCCCIIEIVDRVDVRIQEVCGYDKVQEEGLL